ncbi:MAG TPA: alpha/beta fold hydrolase [Actinomycetales bacterium]|nr:alpha/beta fold hydrolase [Actinomycetales bacterium]
MRELDVTFDGAGVRLAGSLALPESGGGGPFPAALILPGSGPIDRNADMKRMPLRISHDLADALAKDGVASLRYDKRGVGASEGDFLRASLTDNAEDGRAALACLASRPEVDPARLVVIGHSEGALNAMQLLGSSAEGHPGQADVVKPAGVVLLSASAVPGEQTLAWQTRQLAATMPRFVKALLRLLRIDIVRRQQANVAKLKASTEDVIRLDGRRMNARWHRELIAFDPVPLLRGIDIPVLAVTGAKDLQVNPDDLDLIARTVAGTVETRVVPDLTHLLRRDPEEPSLSHYKKQIKQPVDAELLRLVTDWVAKLSDRP